MHERQPKASMASRRALVRRRSHRQRAHDANRGGSGAASHCSVTARPRFQRIVPRRQLARSLQDTADGLQSFVSGIAHSESLISGPTHAAQPGELTKWSRQKGSRLWTSPYQPPLLTDALSHLLNTYGHHHVGAPKKDRPLPRLLCECRRAKLVNRELKLHGAGEPEADQN
jgi:hypothetical protein